MEQIDIKGDFTKDFDERLQSDKYVLTSKTIYDDGNEEYIVLLFDFYKWVENSDNYKDRIAKVDKIIEDVMEDDCFQMGDHACTLEYVTHGNSTIIALITCCK
tara:strand:+ start:730 stop:1038 length:309 start_codon:yes stop_codon:yes gene_type:complete